MEMIGRTVGRYRVVSRLGAGGMGVVYLAEDTELGRRVALKFLPPAGIVDPHALERFRVEARAASGLNHPCICTIYDVGEVDRAPYIVMEALDGEPLNVRATGRPMKIDDLLDIGVQLADALDAAHAHGIIHRDVKPANIFLDARNRAKLLDFGLAKLTQLAPPAVTGLDTTSRSLRRGDHDDRLTEPGTAMGTVSYMSPEQARGEEVDARTDLFSLGAVLYEMATGQRAFHGATVAVTYDAILNRTPPPVGRHNPLLPERLEGIIAKALEKNPDLRYQHASELRADLRRAQRDLDLLSSTRRLDSVYLGGVEARAPETPRRIPRWSVAASAVVVVAVAAIGLWVLLPGGDGEDAGPSQAAAGVVAEPVVGVAATSTAEAPPDARTAEAALAEAASLPSVSRPEPVSTPPRVERPAQVAVPSPPSPRVTETADRQAPAPDANAPAPAAGGAAQTGGRVPREVNEPAAAPETVSTPDAPPREPEASVPAVPSPAPAAADSPPAPVVAPPPAVEPPEPPATAVSAVDSSAASAPAVESDAALIRAVLRDYERAIETRDLALYRSVVPGLSASGERALLDSFRNVQSQQVDLRVDSLVVEGDTAIVRLTQQVVAQTPEGRRSGSSTPTFRLERTARGWVIADVSVD